VNGDVYRTVKSLRELDTNSVQRHNTQVTYTRCTEINNIQSLMLGEISFVQVHTIQTKPAVLLKDQSLDLIYVKSINHFKKHIHNLAECNTYELLKYNINTFSTKSESCNFHW